MERREGLGRVAQVSKAARVIAAYLESSELQRRFWSRVARLGPEDCWLWKATLNTYGYGLANVKGMMTSAHRIAFALANGAPATVVMHRCDNPSCCNPAHLVAGTIAENNRDRSRKGRSADRRGSKHPLARLTEADVVEIHRMRKAGALIREIADRYAISRPHAGYILSRRFWSHVKVSA